MVNLASFELFERQPAEYRKQVLPNAVRRRVAIEAGCSLGWRHYVGLDGAIITRDGFGASAPFKEILNQYGFTAANVYNAAKSLLAG